MKDFKLIDKENYTEKELKDLLRLAYKKLKSDAYHDNSNLFLKSEIAKTEHEIDTIIDEAYNLITEDREEILKVGFYCLPKQVSSTHSMDENIVCNDLNTSNYNIDKVTYFINIDLKYHILGTVWVLLAGEKLLKENSKYIYGRKLDNNFKNDDITLFKPYHKEYSKWRDKAITHTEHLINSYDRCLMIALDIKDYYYSVNIEFDKIREELKINSTEYDNKWNKILISRENLLSKLTNQVEEICLKYSMEILDIKEEKNILPIGYIPSSILSNWYLKKFDENICKEIRPIYYGRYIDDMLIVLPYSYEKKDQNQNQIISRYFCKSNILIPSLLIKDQEEKKYIFFDGDGLYSIENTNLTKYRRKEEIKNCITNILKSITPKDIELKESIAALAEKFDITNIEIYSRNFELNLKKLKLEELIDLVKQIIKDCNVKSQNIERIYLLRDKLNLKQKEVNSMLTIQNTKIKIYDFKPDGSKAVIEKFKKEIKKNASVFKFLPEKDIVVNRFDEEVLDIKYSEGINKIRSIEDFSINKYNLSKFLAQVIYSERLDNDSYSNDLEEKILKLFNGMHIIEFYTLWEKAMTCYLVNDNKQYMKKMIKNIKDEIDNIDTDKLKLESNIYKHKDVSDINSNLKESLNTHLKNTISMIWALNDDIFIEGEYLNTYKLYKDEIKELVNKIRYSNMLNHLNVMESLINYTEMVSNKENQKMLDIEGLNLVKNQWKKDSINFGVRCTKINNNYENKIKDLSDFNINPCGKKMNVNKINKCIYDISENSKVYSPRFVHLHEIILYEINKLMTKGKVISGTRYIEDAVKLYKEINNITDLQGSLDYNLIVNSFNKNKNDNAREVFSKHVNDGKISTYSVENQLLKQNEINVNLINIKSKINKAKLKIAIAHIDVVDSHYKDSIMKTPNLNGKRLQKLYHILNQAAKQEADMIIFPELSIPYSWLSVMANFSRKHQLVIVCGLEHVVYENNIACNYLATILPGEYNKYTYSMIKLRLKNHYAPSEIEMLRGYNLEIPKMRYSYYPMDQLKPNEFIKEYDLFRWSGIDFSCYNCFELSSLNDRGLFMSYADLLIGSVHNKDVNHYSNIIESLSRDVHCYFAQVNNSKSGDNRIVAPKKTVEKNVLQITGGLNDTLLVGEIDIKKLRAFQLQDYNLQLINKSFKPTPPEFNKNILKLRMNKPL